MNALLPHAVAYVREYSPRALDTATLVALRDECAEWLAQVDSLDTALADYLNVQNTYDLLVIVLMERSQ